MILRSFIRPALTVLTVCLFFPGLAGAEPLGLILTPTARMDEVGTVRADLTTMDPYLHGNLGFQIAKPLYLNIRQTAEISGLNDDADRLYPGVDVKWRFLEEGPWWPEGALGLQSAVGHKRMAAEYLAFSKRVDRFDFSGGIGWGRMGSAQHVKNPLKIFSKHFSDPRGLDGDMPNGPEDWFTGEHIGFFGGLSYRTPFLDGLSLEAEWNADRFRAEQAAFDYDTPKPWSIGASYSPRPWVTFGGALIGGEKVMASLSLQSPAGFWPGRTHTDKTPAPLHPFRTGSAMPDQMELAAQTEDIILYDTYAGENMASTRLMADGAQYLPLQLGRAARHIGNHAGTETEGISITPTRFGLSGPSITLIRRDLEQAMARQQGSPQEIWRNVKIDAASDPAAEAQDHFIPFESELRLILDNQMSLSEEDSGLLYRTSLILDEKTVITRHIMAGGALRLNVADNLDGLRDFRLPALLPIRSDIDAFAGNRVGLDSLYFAWSDTFNDDIHVAALTGHVEEMYHATGADILYRPIGKRFAVGAEAWLALKRDPESTLNLMLTGDRVLTGHLKAYYEFPETDMTLEGRIGRYLNEDIGGTIALSRRFDGGPSVRAFATATDQADFDIFGGTTHLLAGLEMTLPLGNVPFIPDGSILRARMAPLGRDTGQMIESPLPLYEVTEPLSYRHITQYWTGVVE